MSLIATSRTPYVLLGLGLLGLGVFALVHPEFARGGSLILLGLAVLERGSGRTQRLFIWIAGKLARGEPPLRRRRAVDHRARPHRVPGIFA